MMHHGSGLAAPTGARLRLLAFVVLVVGTLSCLHVASRLHLRQRDSAARVAALIEATAADPDRGALRQAIAEEEQAQLGRLLFGVGVAYGVLFLLLAWGRSEPVPMLSLAAPYALWVVLALGHVWTPLVVRGLVAGPLLFVGAGLLLAID